MNIPGGRSIIVCILCGFLAACSADANTTVPTETNNQGPSSESLVLPNLLLDVDGQVELRRLGWTAFLPADFGTILRPGDLVRVAKGGQAAVFCGDEAAWEQGPSALIGDGQEHGVPCETGRPPRPWPDVAALRGDSGTQTAYVVQPRSTALLSGKPTLVWQSSNSARDTLSIVSILSDDGEERPMIESSEGSLAWPASWPPLKPGGTYVLVIGDEPADPGTTIGRGFWLLDTSQAEDVRSREAKLRQPGLSETAQSLLVAELYRSYSLNAEAIELLKPLAEAVPSPVIWVNLGRTYMEIGLPEEAYGSYTEALALAERLGDLLTAGEAHIGLALVAQMKNDNSSFDAHLEQARTIIDQVGDAQMMQEIERLTQ